VCNEKGRCKACAAIPPPDKPATQTVQIVSRWTGVVLFTATIPADSPQPMRVAVEQAAAAKANLYGANLTRANLDGANLDGANLDGANLDGANLYGANLYGANLYGANLTRANLYGANLYGANLTRANLYGANLTRANLPSPTMVLLASWGDLPEPLTRQAMAYDAACHPDPEAFARWAASPTGKCPYDGAKVGRACNFREARKLWDPALPCPRPYDLMCAILEAKCKGFVRQEPASK
jgi:hypothetical protein